MSVRVETNIGNLVVELFCQEAPIACRNFLKLCKLKYYNWCIFHHVERDFIAQSGDPTGTGQGGVRLEAVLEPKATPYFAQELVKALRHTGRGVLGMANAGKDCNGSQFYIQLANRPLAYLDGQKTVFGRVVEGLEVLEKLNAAFVDGGGRPLQDIYIKRTVLLDDPFPDPSNFPLITHSPPPSKAFTTMRRPGLQDDMEGSTMLEADEERRVLAREEARSRAIALELMGERPSADMAPPENVLFVCKLNPLTEASDLRTIFLRFGPIINCDIVKDRRTGQSLGYAFIEFESKEACEESYRKMNNVRIDDRRIRVDFSQSVSKLKGQWEAGKRGQRGNELETISQTARHHRSHQDHDERSHTRQRYSGEREYSDRERRHQSRSPRRNQVKFES